MSRALAAYENQAILFCFAAALHRNSHTTRIPAEMNYDVCCLRCMYIYPVCSYLSVHYPVQYRRPYSKQNRCYFLVFRANELRSGRKTRDTFPRRACMSGAPRSLCPFPFARPKNAKKITPVLWDRYLYFFLYFILFHLFTSFSGHWPAQRECARMGLIGSMQGAIRTQSHNP